MTFNVKNNQIINNSAFVQSEGLVVGRLGFILNHRSIPRNARRQIKNEKEFSK